MNGRLPILLILLGFITAAVLPAADTEAPILTSVAPDPGTIVSSLDQVTLNFSEPVTGLSAADFLVNNQPIQRIFGSSNRWTFFFSQPAPGPVTLRWDANHTVTDLSGNRLNEKAPEASWTYTLDDRLAPGMRGVDPYPGAVLRNLSDVEVVFDEPVQGVDASDLLLDGRAASTVTGSGAGPYRFHFSSISTGVLNLSWAADHGIQDLSAHSNLFQGGSWSYRVDPSLAQDPLWINEWVADNLNGLPDEDGATGDWIELWNRSTQSVSLLGWSITPDLKVPRQWIFPDISLDPGAYLVVFASGKDRKPTVPKGNLHTNFRLSRTGGSLSLVRPEYPAASAGLELKYGPQRGDISYGRTPSGEFQYLAVPTPGATNASSAGFVGFAAPPTASIASGFFDHPITLELSCETPQATLYYTLDGSVPTVFSLLYSGPIPLSGSADRGAIPVRAIAVKHGLLPSLVSTWTYVFPEQVLNQSATPSGFPTTWVSPGKLNTSGDYQMDPKITQDPIYRPMILQGLTNLPTLSLVTDEKLIFEPAGGVYVRRDPATRQPVHAELIFADGTPGFSLDAGFEVQGGSSPTDSGGDWKDKNLSMRLIFSGDFGNSKLKYPLYPNSPVEEFDTLIIDSALNNVWNHMTDDVQRNKGQYAREQFVNELMMRTVAQPPRGRYVHTYINGLYWGMKVLHERPEEKWAASYFGGEPADYDVLKHDSGTVIAGSAVNYSKMLSALSKPQSNITNYINAIEYLDLDWFIDYMMVNFWAGNTDWDQHNWYAIRSRKPGAPGWRFISWDAEHVMESVDDDQLGLNNTGAGTGIFSALKNNPEFRLRWADHVQKHFFNDGIFYVNQANPQWNPDHPEWNRPAALYMSVIQTIDPSIVCESARWGDVARPGKPYTRNVEWLHELQSLLFITNSPGNTTRYFPLRSSNMLSRFKRLGLYPTNALPPVFRQQGGRVESGFALSMTNPASGSVYFTLDGTDPRVFRSGAVAASATEYQDGAPPVLSRTTLVKARTLNGTNWSALNEARFEVGQLGSPLRLTELMFHPAGGDALEFIELKNVGDLVLDVGNWTLNGVGFGFVPGTLLAPGQVVVLASGADTNAWVQAYPGVHYAGVYPGSLDNGGERLSLVDAAGRIQWVVEYGDAKGWPKEADGGGASLELLDEQANPNDPAQWVASSEIGGSPGRIGAHAPSSSVRLSEVLAWNNSAVNHDETFPDFVELKNDAPLPVDLSGWKIQDHGASHTFVFPANVVLGSQQYLVVWCDTNRTSGLHTGFALDRQSDAVFLYDHSGRRVDGLTFGSQIPDRSVSRIGADWRLGQATPGLANQAVALASQDSLWVNEFLLHPEPGQEAWLEVYNRNPNLPVSLQGIALAAGSSGVQEGYPWIAFLPPNGFVTLSVDGGVGPRHFGNTDLKEAKDWILYQSNGESIQHVSIPESWVTGVSYGSYPDGTENWFSFPGNATPDLPNRAPLTYSGIGISEWLARNQTAVQSPAGHYADFIELFNPLSTVVSLDGYVLEIDHGVKGRFVIPQGITLAAGAYGVVWCDPELPASTNSLGIWNTGFELPGHGATLSLRNADGAVLQVSYGLQAPDFAVGLSSGSFSEWRLLSHPTPGAQNAAPAALGDASKITVNEWMADPANGPAWVEVWNTEADCVDLQGFAIANSPSRAGVDHANRFPALSFLPPQFTRLIADGQVEQGANHLSWKLDPLGGSVIWLDLRGSNSAPVFLDSVSYGAPGRDISQGRWPDGSNSILSFPETPSPEESNWLPISTVHWNEFLLNPTVPGGGAVELRNETDHAIDLSGWYVSDDSLNLRKWKIPAGTVIGAQGYLVLGEAVLSSPRGSGISQGIVLNPLGMRWILSRVDATGALDGYRDEVIVGASAKGMAWGRIKTCARDLMVPMESVTLGAPNSNPRKAPVIYSELFPSPSAADLPDSDLEFIEIQNTTAQSILLGSGDGSTPGWRVSGAVEMGFPRGLSLAAAHYLVLVSFDPSQNSEKASAFRQFYALTDSVPLVGPYRGHFSGSGDFIRLERPLIVEQEDVSTSTFEMVDSFAGTIWPVGHRSLLRASRGPGGDPGNWIPGVATPGRVNQSGFGDLDSDADGMPDLWEQAHHLRADLASDADLDSDGDGRNNLQEFLDGTDPENAKSFLQSPRIIGQPTGGKAFIHGDFASEVSVEGSAPILYQWFLNGVPVAEQTNRILNWVDVGPAQAGRYQLRALNAAGCAWSDEIMWEIPIPPTLLKSPLPLVVDPGKTATFNVVAVTRHPPLRYQWFVNGTPIPSAQSDTLQISGAQLADEGDYSVRVLDAEAFSDSASAHLTVKVKPTIVQPLTPVSQTVAIGSNATFMVSAVGSLPITYRWRKVGVVQTLTNITLYSTSCVFTLPRVRTNDAGKYFVTVTNIANASAPLNSSTSILAVIRAPIITRQPQGKTVDPGVANFFDVGVDGDGPFTFQWFKNGVPVEGATQDRLEWASVQSADAGSYTVAISNPAATVLSEAARLFVNTGLRLELERQGPILQLFWAAAPGRTYRLESSVILDPTQWEALGGEYVATAPATEIRVDVTPSDHARYYRLVLVAP